MKGLIDQAREILRGARRVVSFSGAGLSAESGVPTFRSSGAGDGHELWSKFDPMILASPEGFERDPRRVSEWYSWRRQKIAAAQPNPAHVALASCGNVMHVTQNVDDLLHRAGASQVIQLHGSIGRDHCHNECGFEEMIDMAHPPELRRCACGGYLRPSVVWFGEALPREPWEQAERAFREADAMLVVGTSAVVYPAAGLIHVAASSGAAILVVNTETSEASDCATVELIGRAGDIVPKLLDG